MFTQRLTVVGLLVGALGGQLAARAQSISVFPQVVVLTDGGVFGVQVTCTDCDLPNGGEIRAFTDDTNYATVQSDPASVTGSPFVTIVNVKGESQGGTILRLNLVQSGGSAVVAEAFVTIEVVSIDDDCIFDDLTRNRPDASERLDSLRRYRDEVLSSTSAGGAYVDAYYRHAPEVVRILRQDAGLRADVLRLIEAHRGTLELILAGEVAVLDSGEVAEVQTVLERAALHASRELQTTIRRVRGDLRSGKPLWALGIETPGRRER